MRLLFLFLFITPSLCSILTASSFVPSLNSIYSSIKSDLPHADKLLEPLEKDKAASVRFAEDVIGKMGRLETNLGWSGIHVEKDSAAHGQLIENAADEEGIGQVRKALVAAKASQHLMNNHCHSISSNKIHCSKYLSLLPLSPTPLASSCPSSSCPSPTRYRSIDGSCGRGRAFSGYRRLLYPAYHDGIAEPRRAADKRALPSARAVSVALVRSIDRKDQSLTMGFAQWGQFVAHDLAHTASSRMLFSDHSVMCCDNTGHNLAPRYIHPFCFPISMSFDDPFYSKYNVQCMSYVRSLPAISSNCSFGPVDQMNQVTHFLDGSQIYGSTPAKNARLREYQGGRLLSSDLSGRQFLPLAPRPLEDCQVKNPRADCYRAGDVRVNMQPHLTAMHLLWLREHNRIAGVLQNLNRGWDDEKVYQETRRIVIAEIQHITYNEWMPILLGEKYSKKFSANEFNEDIDPTVSNSFATAAIRFTNSLVDSFLNVYDENRNTSEVLRLHEHFNKPQAIEKPGNLDGLIRGLATQSCQKVDLDVVTDVTEKLYAPGRIGFDALSLDIQRGRDHGLPGYTEFREFCGLPAVKNFEDLSDFIPMETIKTLRSIYTHPSDIDLLVGGLAEKPFYDSLLGPTFTCLAAEQLSRTRQGDRYFYTNADQPTPFSSAQLKQIKKATLGAVFCDNGDDIKSMQAKVFNVIDQRNKLQDCGSMPKMDLSFWKE